MEKFKKIMKSIRKTMKKIFKFLFIIFFILFIIGASVTAYLGYKYYPEYERLTAEAKGIISEMNEDLFIRLEPTQIIRKDGELVREFTPTKYTYIENKDIPINVKKAFVSIEDKKFHTHDGVDYKANLRAGLALIKNKGKITQGGSTITQQLVKIMFLSTEQTYTRKIREVFLSWELEKKLNKDLIFEYYVNNIYYANGAYGIETASNYYFSKSSSELTLAETAFLVAIPNNPTIFNPIENKENTIRRQRLILLNMLEDEVITQEVYDEAIKQPIELDIAKKSSYVPEDFEISYVMNSTIELIMEYEGFPINYKFTDDEQRARYKEGYDRRFSEINERIRQGGYTITSTIEPTKQKALQTAVNQGLQDFPALAENGLYSTQGAAVTIDNITHELVAIVGGRTEEGQVNTFNRAALSYRQPGSVIKPIAAYGVEADIELLGFTIYEDIKDDKGPKNSTGKFQGKVTAREALVQSINTIPFEFIKNRGPSLVHEYLYKMRFTKIVDGDRNAGIAIGGFTYGTTPLEIAGGFSTLANNGKYVRPTGVDKILFKDELIYENKKIEIPVYKEGTAYLMTDILKGVFTNRGTGKAARISHPAAGKTGTTDDNKDGWFAGYTRYYTTAIWVGNDTPKKVKNLWGGTYPSKIWRNYMEEIHQGLEMLEFEKPAGTKTVYVKPGTEEVHSAEIKGYNKEIIPIHLLNKVTIITKGSDLQEHVEEIVVEESELEVTPSEDITPPIDEEIPIELEEQEPPIVIPSENESDTFFRIYGIELEDELEQMRLLEKAVIKILNTKVKNKSDLNYVIQRLDEVLFKLELLYSSTNQEKIIILVNNAKGIVKDKYDNR